MNNWREYKLSDLMYIIGGGTPKTSISDYWGGHIPWLSVVDFGNSEKKVYKTEKTITEKGLINSSTKVLKRGQIIISARGTVGELAVLGSDMTFNQSCYGLNSKSDICTNDFLYYLLKYKISELKRNAHGAVFDTITRNTFETIFASIPDLSTQTAIAEILSSLDDKIELNNKINQELEALAQTLFKQWFIDFEFPNENGEPYKSSGGEMVESELGEIPKGWVTVRLGDNYLVSDFVANGSFAALKENVKILEEPSFAIFLRNTDSKSNFTGDLRYVDEKTYNFLSKSRITGNEVCISNVADVGTVFRPPVYLNKPLTLGNNLVYFKSDYPNYFYLYFKYFQGQDQIQSITSGSAQLKFNKTDFRNLKLLNAPKNIFNAFDLLINDLWELQSSRLSENIQLTNLRDTLLPKLISGELEVSKTQTTA